MHVREFFSRRIFPAHFVGFLFSYFCRFLLFSLLFRENEGVHCLCYSSGVYFTVFWPFSQRNRQIVEEVWTMSEQLVKSIKTLEDKPRKLQGVDGRFFTNCEKCYRKSCKYMRNNSTRLPGKKNFNLTIPKFWAQRWGDILPTNVGKPWREKRRCKLHAGMAPEEFVNYIP